jgi:hypothetical protein
MTDFKALHETEKFPVASRLTDGDRPTPYVGPDFKSYQAAHAATVGDGSDEWWGKVRIYDGLDRSSDYLSAERIDRPRTRALASRL